MNTLDSDLDDHADPVVDNSQRAVVRRLAHGLLEVHAGSFEPSERPPSSEVAAILMAEAVAGIETALSLHRRIVPSTSLHRIDFGAVLLELCEQIVGRMARARRFDIRVDIAPRCLLPVVDVARLSLIATELIINAIQHAHPAGIPGILEIGSHVDPVGTLTLTVSDDGIGLPADFDPRRDGGLGLILIRSLGRRLGATISYESIGLGLQVTVTMPVRLRPQ
ncbi:MAG: sensor histidine kinase [Rhodovulum sp.]|nr:sensor histidine kinase [Rhodovulum sp.]